MKDDLTIKEEQLEVAKVSFSFTFTRDEAEAYIKKPKGQIARNIRKYMCKIFEVAAQKMLESKPEEIVKECNINMPDEL